MTTAALATIYNMLAIDEQLGTSGQPTSAQLAAIKEAGYEVVINLATGTTPRDLPREAEVVAQQGMAYVHIPVVWEHPTAENFAQFCAAMEATQGTKRFVHCIANMRVSAFVYLYRVLRQGLAPEAAQATLNQIWQPNAIWQQFIDETLARGSAE